MEPSCYPTYATSPSDQSSAEAASSLEHASASPVDSKMHLTSPEPTLSMSRSSSKAKQPGKRVIKAHHKTRQGCFNCKKRKVKCSEERPGCVPCARNGLRCVYPLTREAMALLPTQVRDPQAQSMADLHSGRLEYTALDLRLLHHFIIDAYPHLPLDCDEVWQREIPSLAHQYTYLMHSLLSVAASYLVRRGEVNLEPAAHFHRLRAIAGVNDALNTSNRSADDDDALVSACYALVFQNAHTGDNPTGFWITVRTIATIGQELKLKNRTTRFSTIGPSGHAKVMMERLASFPRLRQDLIYGGIRSLCGMAGLCQFGLEQELYTLILETYYKLLSSSVEGYFSFASIYAMVATMSPSDFQRLTNPNEHIIQLLQSHFLALQSIMGPILVQEWAGRPMRLSSDPSMPDRSTARWADSVGTLPQNSPLRQHLVWTSEVQRRANEGTLFDDILEKGPVEAVDHDSVRTVQRQWSETLGLANYSPGEAAAKEYERRVDEYAQRRLHLDDQS